MARHATWGVPAALAAAMGAAALLLFIRGDELTFYSDQWGFMVERRGHDLDVFLNEQNGHLMAVPIFVHKALFEVFGAESYVPFQLTAIAVQLAVAGVFFAIVRRRVDDVVALAFTAAVLFFAPGWETLLSAVGMLNTISLAAGLGMLLALEAGTRRGDVAAAVLLTISVFSFSYGPLFAAAAVVDVMLRPGGVRRLWIAAVPLALYGLWVLGWGGESDTRLANLPGLARSVADSASAVAASLTGLYRPGGEGRGTVSVDATLGAPLAFGLAALVAYRLRGPVRGSPRLWALVVLALSFWVSLALVQDEGRTTTSSRFLYPGAVFTLLIVAEVLNGVRVGLRGRAALAVWLAILLVAATAEFRWAGEAFRELAEFNRAQLAALELARDTVAPDYKPEASTHELVRGHYLYPISAAAYFSAIDDYGSAAYSVSELQRAPPEPRQVADLLLAEATGLAAAPSDVSNERGCRRLTPQKEAPASAVVTVPPGGLHLRGRQDEPLDLRLRRFGDEFAVELGTVSGRSGVAVTPAPDAATDVPWRAQLDGIRAPLLACGA